jgi:hypothetical protein
MINSMIDQASKDETGLGVLVTSLPSVSSLVLFYQKQLASVSNAESIFPI